MDFSKVDCAVQNRLRRENLSAMLVWLNYQPQNQQVKFWKKVSFQTTGESSKIAHFLGPYFFFKTRGAAVCADKIRITVFFSFGSTLRLRFGGVILEKSQKFLKISQNVKNGLVFYRIKRRAAWEGGSPYSALLIATLAFDLCI